MFSILSSIVFLITVGLIAAKLYNKNKIHYFYFIIIMFYIFPFISDYLTTIPKMTALSYYSVIIFPFIFNKRLTKGPYYWWPFLLLSIVGYVVNMQNVFIYLIGIFRYIYFFLILLLILKTPLNKNETKKIMYAFVMIGINRKK